MDPRMWNGFKLLIWKYGEAAIDKFVLAEALHTPLFRWDAVSGLVCGHNRTAETDDT